MERSEIRGGHRQRPGFRYASFRLRLLMVGGAYSHARVPFGFWLEAPMNVGRNPCDKSGHFAQWRWCRHWPFARYCYAVRGRGMLAFLVLCAVLAISAGYELVEWMVKPTTSAYKFRYVRPAPHHRVLCRSSSQ
ncbi:DUF2238 domain-containing protein [Immundisolibacter sp.]|uniref:DUF2238 domain-containing protein n=1 Tax=Immundisolibacter sp. TaxID=1934948 RepID=UPI00356B3089